MEKMEVVGLLFRTKGRSVDPQRKMGQIITVQKVCGICETKNGTETDELLQTDGRQRIW